MANLTIKISYPDGKRADIFDALRLRYPMDPEQTEPYTDKELEDKFADDCAALLNRYEARWQEANKKPLGAKRA